MVWSLPKEVINDAEIFIQEEGNNYNYAPYACIPCNRILHHNLYGLAMQ